MAGLWLFSILPPYHDYILILLAPAPATSTASMAIYYFLFYFVFWATDHYAPAHNLVLTSSFTGF